jgi:hypothetical protein
MPTRGSKTEAMSTEWALEVFDWRPISPSDTQGGGQDMERLGKALSGPFAAAVTPTKSDKWISRSAYANRELITSWSEKVTKDGKTKTIKGNKDSRGLVGGITVSSGLKAVSFSRSKARPDGSCTAVIVGPLPSSVRPGNWVIVSSLEQNNGKVTVLPKFIGQIHTVDTSYSTQGSGNIVQTNNIQVKEWSSSLMIDVRYDNRAAAIEVKASGNSQTNILGAISSVSDELKKANFFDSIRKTAEIPTNPYEAAEAFLRLIGVLNANTQETKFGEMNAYRIAMTMPDVPLDLMTRLKMSDKITPNQAFAQGFAKMAIGRQVKPVYANGEWDGIFKSVNDEYSEKSKVFNVFRGDVSSQPIGVNNGILMQVGHGTAWSMISGYCDPSVNEAYTDILYERKGNQIVARPTIFVRGMPYRTRAAEKIAKDNGYFPPYGEWLTMYNTWPMFEDVPRIKLDNVLITGMSLSNTSMTSPNYIWADYQGMDATVRSEDIQHWNTMNTTRLGNEMSRFGGQPLPVGSSFYFVSGRENAWALCRVALGLVWKAFNYRKASGALSIKDNSIPLTIGFNIQFDFGGYTLVAQIEAIQTSFHVNDSGIKETSTTISFSNMMAVDEKKELGFLPVGAFGDMFKVNG